MTQFFYQVDAFTKTPYQGNPAGVCLLPQAVSENWMQNVAREMNLSETAFLVRRPDGFDLRWFTPAVEVDLCGHATLASAHILWETAQLAHDETAHFFTRSGWLTANQRGEWIELDFPATPAEPCEPLPSLAQAMGVTPIDVGKTIFDYLVVVTSEEEVRQAHPDFTALAKLRSRGIILTSRSANPAYDFVSRFFAPAVGINEDPVTGSAHACLGPYWAQRLEKTEMLAYQASSRGGVIKVQMSGERVLLSGQAITVLRAELI